MSKSEKPWATFGYKINDSGILASVSMVIFLKDSRLVAIKRMGIKKFLLTKINS